MFTKLTWHARWVGCKGAAIMRAASEAFHWNSGPPFGGTGQDSNRQSQLPPSASSRAWQGRAGASGAAARAGRGMQRTIVPWWWMLTLLRRGHLSRQAHGLVEQPCRAPHLPQSEDPHGWLQAAAIRAPGGWHPHGQVPRRECAPPVLPARQVPGVPGRHGLHASWQQPWCAHLWARVGHPLVITYGRAHAGPLDEFIFASGRKSVGVSAVVQTPPVSLVLPAQH